MKKFLIFLLFLFCADIFGYKHHLINNSMYNWHIVYKVTAAKGDLSMFEDHMDLGSAYSSDDISEDPNRLQHSPTQSLWIAPYSIIHVNNCDALTCPATGAWIWKSIEAKNMWGTKKNLKEGKSGADSIYWIIEDDAKKGGGNIISRGWAKGGGKSHKWEEYKKKHQNEMRRKYEEFVNNMLVISPDFDPMGPQLSNLTNTYQVAQQAKKFKIQRAKEACEELLKEKLTPARIVQLQDDIKDVQKNITGLSKSDEKKYSDQQIMLKQRQAKLERVLWQVEVDYEQQGCKDTLKKDFTSENEQKMIRCYHIQSVKAGYVNLDALKKDIANTEKKIAPMQERIDRLKNKTGWFASDMHKEAGRLEIAIMPLHRRLAKLKEILETVSHGEQSYQKLGCPAIIGEQYNALETSASKN